MQATIVSVRAFAVSSLLGLAGIAACREGTTESVGSGLVAGAVATPQWAVDAAYGGCPTDAQDTCNFYHPGSVATGYCVYGACFEMSRGEVVRVVAADGMGAFPSVWFAWHERAVAPTGTSSCAVTRRGNKTRVEIPAPNNRCSLDLTTDGYVYHELFASNAISGCLAWLECRQSQ